MPAYMTKLTPRGHSDLQRWLNADEIKLVHSCTGCSNGPAFIRTAASHKLMLSALQRFPVRGRSHHLVMGGAETPGHNYSCAILAMRLQLSHLLLCIVSRSAVKTARPKNAYGVSSGCIPTVSEHVRNILPEVKRPINVRSAPQWYHL